VIRKLALSSLLVIAFVHASAQQQVVPCGPFVPHLSQNYDNFSTGVYTPQLNAFGIFAPPFINLVLGTANIVNPQGVLAVLNQPQSPISPPNYMTSRQTDIEWRFNLPIRRFGGGFAALIPNTVAEFRFYDSANNLIAVHNVTFGAPMAWQWVGFCHINGPQIRRILVATISGFPGLIAYDNTMIRYN